MIGEEFSVEPEIGRWPQAVCLRLRSGGVGVRKGRAAAGEAVARPVRGGVSR